MGWNGTGGGEWNEGEEEMKKNWEKSRQVRKRRETEAWQNEKRKIKENPTESCNMAPMKENMKLVL